MSVSSATWLEALYRTVKAGLQRGNEGNLQAVFGLPGVHDSMDFKHNGRQKDDVVSDKEWKAQLRELQVTQSARDVTSARALSLTLAELWSHLRACPNSITTAYRQLSEDLLTTHAETQRQSLAGGSVAWHGAATDVELALEIGGQMRALDAELADRPSFAQAPVGVDGYLCREVDAFVIPRRDAKLLDGRTGPGRGFGRRGTPHHRILPRKIDDFEVQLVWEPRLSAGRFTRGAHLFGAALLPNMKLVADAGEPRWVALSADCPDDGATIVRQVTACYDDDAVAMLYPELSMPDARRAALTAALAARSLRMEIGKGPALVVAGSWHDREADGVRNVMRVLDKTGAERMRYKKSSAYFRNGVEEGILVDRVIPVLVNTDFLATFAICLDFCERELSTPYDRLDVDLIFVASHGNAQTMKGHEANAGDFSAKFGGHVFVVQHSDTPGKPVGYVLPPSAADGPIGEDREWSTRKIQFN